MQHTISSKYLFLLALFISVFALALPGLAQDDTDIELVGTVDALTLNSITVNQQVMDISAAQIGTPLQTGALVRVQGTLNANGTITVRQINAVEEGVQPGEAEIEGVLEGVNGTTITVNGQTIDIANAEILSQVSVGDRIHIHATTTGTNTWSAREIDAANQDDDDDDDDNGNDNQSQNPDEFELTGTLQAMGDGFIVVAGQTISVTNAEIDDPLLLGVLVKVHIQTSNGTLAAREVENASLDDDDNDNQNGNTNANINGNFNTNDNGNVNINTNGNFNVNTNVNGNDNVTTAVSPNAAAATFLQVYPNTTVTNVELVSQFGGVLVWVVQGSNGVQFSIDAQTGVVLAINQGGQNTNTNGNFNDNGNVNTNNNVNANTNDNGNVNTNTNVNTNSNNDNDDDDGGNNDNSGGGNNDNGGGGNDNGGGGNNDNGGDDDDDNDNGDDDDDDDDSGMGGMG